MSKRPFPFLSELGGHLSEDTLTRLICDELSIIRTFLARRHLSSCWQCRARHERREKAALAVIAYRESRLKPHLPLSNRRRERFADQVGVLFAEKSPQPSWAHRLFQISRPKFPSMNPTLATGIVFALASVVCITLWLQQRTPNLTSNALLVRAETWDGQPLGAVTGVVYQKVKIRTPDDSLERTIYRDVQGQRKPRLVMLAAHQDQIRRKLAGAGLDWDAPLSATSFQDWHDHQRVREDQITRSGKHLLRLTTSTPNGDIVEQSLTVRDTDFHPVERTIAFRGSDTVEIAEVDYRVLPWEAVDASVFEPLSGAVVTGLTLQPEAPHLTLPSTPTAGQLDEAELGARLLLNHLHADTDEQIELNRRDNEIEVKGVVETEQRKQELQSQLRMIPHVLPSILSFDDLKNRDTAGGQTSKLSMANIANEPSPLELYLQVQGHGTDTLSPVSQRLLNDALIATRESKALREILQRFSEAQRKEPLTEIAVATATELFFRTVSGFSLALEDERQLLKNLPANTSIPADSPVNVGDASALVDMAARNLALCKELTLGNSEPSRPADVILSELMVNVNALHANSRQLQTSFAAVSGKK